MDTKIRAWIETLLLTIVEGDIEYTENEDGSLSVYLPDIDSSCGGYLFFAADFTPPMFPEN